MKVEVKVSEEKPKYPYIGISKNKTIILFVGTNLGTVLESNQWPIGNYSYHWCEEDFKPFEGEITLSND